MCSFFNCLGFLSVSYCLMIEQIRSRNASHLIPVFIDDLMQAITHFSGPRGYTGVSRIEVGHIAVMS